MHWFLGKTSDEKALVIRKTVVEGFYSFTIEEVDISEMKYAERSMLPRLYEWPLKRRRFHYNRADYD